MDKEQNRRLQEISDRRIELGIEGEAQRLLLEHLEQPHQIYVMKPFITYIDVYDEDSAKYTSSRVKEAVFERFEVLKNQLGI